MIQAFILQIAQILIEVYFWAMFVYIFSSWVPPLRESKFGEILGAFVEPYLGIFRRIIPPIGMLDISPIFAFLAYRFLSSFAYTGLETILYWIF